MKPASAVRRILEPDIAARLAEARRRLVNYDAQTLDLDHPAPGWNVDRRAQALPAEAPGDPEGDGSFAVAARLIRGYEFADPSIVRAHYDRDEPLEGRTMLLELRALGLARIFVGVRVCAVYDEARQQDGRPAQVFGWAYRTLEGHVERGQMNWEVWKWADSGAVEFRVHAVSRTASIPNPAVWLGFRLLRGHERTAFLDSTSRRMRELTAIGLDRERGPERIRAAGEALTKRRLPAGDRAHEELARQLEHPDLSS